VQDGTSFLNPPIMSTSDDLAVDDQDRANGNAALCQTFAGLFDGGFQKCVF
jgi:hypothetical protein